MAYTVCYFYGSQQALQATCTILSKDLLQNIDFAFHIDFNVIKLKL